MNIPRIHHYTNIESLALILESRKLRFNRLDRVDDLREAQKHQGIEFGKYFFVSCWTHAQSESIPQWHMYTDKMAGVRISLPVMPFQRKRFKRGPEWKIRTKGKLLSPLSNEEHIGRNYFVVPLLVNVENFAGPMKYTKNFKERYAKAVKVNISPDDPATGTFSRPFDLVRLKSKDWEFQQEYRFFFFVVPSIWPMPMEADPTLFYATLPNDILQQMKRGIAPGVKCLDVDLSGQALDEMTRRKHARYDAVCGDAGWRFLPLIADCFAAFCPAGRTTRLVGY